MNILKNTHVQKLNQNFNLIKHGLSSFIVLILIINIDRMSIWKKKSWFPLFSHNSKFNVAKN